MPIWTRVRDKATGHEYSVQNVMPPAHEVLDKPAADAYGRPLPAKPRVDLQKAELEPGDQAGDTTDPPPDAGEGSPSTDAGPSRSARRRS